MKKPGIPCLAVLSILIWGVLSPAWISAQEGIKTPLNKVVLQLRWMHQFQFAGYYTAKAKKFYQKEGFDVDIRSGGFNINTVDEVVQGKAQFGVTNSEILLSRLRDKKPVVVLAPIFQHSPLVFLTRKDTLITHPQDFIGKRVMLTRQIRDIELHATLLNEGVDFDQFEQIDRPLEKEDLFDAGIDVVSAYLTNQPYYYKERNIGYTLIHPKTYGVDFYGDTIFTTGEYIDKFPHRIEAFKRASIKGWEYAMANKQEVIDLIIKEYPSNKTRAHLEYEAAAMDSLILKDMVAVGQNNPARWKQIAEIFVKNGILEKGYSLDGFIYTPPAAPDPFWARVTIAVLSGGIFLFLMITIALYIFNNRLNREIEEKEKSEQALVQSEARLKAMFENIYSGVAIYAAVDDGGDFVIRSFNKAAQQIEEVSLEDVLGKRVSEIFPEMKESGLVKVIHRVYQSGHPEHLSTRQYKNRQITAWRENYVYRLPSGEIAVVCNDETVRKKAEINRKHLDTINFIIINTRHTEDMLQNLLDAMLEIFQCDRTWLLNPCDPNAAYFNLCLESARKGFKRLGNTDVKIKNTPGIAASMAETLASEHPVAYSRAEMSFEAGQLADEFGTKSEIRMAIYPRADQPWMLGMHRCESSAQWAGDDRALFKSIGRRIADGLHSILLIEELREANQTLSESEDRFEKIFHSSPVGLAIAALDELIILNINKSCRKITGFEDVYLLGRSMLETGMLFTPESMPVVENLKHDLNLSHMDIQFFNSRNEIRDGYLSSQTVTIAGKKCVVVAIEDITEYKKVQEEKNTAQKHAAEQEKYALIGQVAGKMAHDFNNILGAIMGNTELSLVECDDPEILQTLKLILEQTKRGRNLTRNLVAFAKDQEPRQDYFDLNEKINLVLNLLKKDLEGIPVSRHFGGDIPELLADPGMIENALVNIIHNAVHAMSRTERPQLIIQTGHDANNILIHIMDNGCGIPPEHKNSVYAPAFTLKNNKDAMGAYDPSVKGTGYGLFNVKKIIEKHKGQIWFDSEVGQGTRFYISLPVIKRDLTKEEKVEIKKSSPVENKRILLVEDEESISDVQSMILQGEPFYHHVDIAQNGHVATELMEKNKYDLISLDYRLPGGLSGMDLYKTIRQADTRVPILFISGNIDFLESIISLTQNDKFLDHLSKPCQNRTYVDCINRLLERAAV